MRHRGIFGQDVRGTLDLTADLPLPARTGLRSDIVASHRVSQSASRRLIGQMIWIFFVLVLAAGLAGLVPPVEVLVAAIPIPIALLLTSARAESGTWRLHR